jgi:hypothetical protein
VYLFPDPEQKVLGHVIPDDNFHRGIFRVIAGDKRFIVIPEILFPFAVPVFEGSGEAPDVPANDRFPGAYPVLGEQFPYHFRAWFIRVQVKPFNAVFGFLRLSEK